MNIILGNDDGINHKGLLCLANSLRKRGHNLLIVAPESNRSAFSHSLTIRRPIKISEQSILPGVKSYKISGTPADCIKMAVLLFRDFKPDFIASGINDAQNIGTDTFYSGTLGMVEEGAFYGISGAAFSAHMGDEIPFEQLAEISADIIEDLYLKCNKNSKIGDVFNVNFPNAKPSDFKGIKYTPLGRQLYADIYEQIDNNTYQLDGELLSGLVNNDCDVFWTEQNYVTITPICHDRTDYKKLQELKD